MLTKNLKEFIKVDGWQSEWPTEINTLWWFYGNIDNRNSSSPDLFLVEIRSLGNNIAYIAQGHFLYRTEYTQGLFLRCIPPIPNDEQEAISYK